MIARQYNAVALSVCVAVMAPNIVVSNAVASYGPAYRIEIARTQVDTLPIVHWRFAADFGRFLNEQEGAEILWRDAPAPVEDWAQAYIRSEPAE